MALIEGTNYSGHFSELTVIEKAAPSKTGATSQRYSSSNAGRNAEAKKVTKTGAGVAPYYPELAIILGTEQT